MRRLDPEAYAPAGAPKGAAAPDHAV
jgi:hypothetical protein